MTSIVLQATAVSAIRPDYPHIPVSSTDRPHRHNLETELIHTASSGQPIPITGDSPASPTDTHIPIASTPRIVVCALLKNEVPYAVEWIEFYRMMGVSKIIIYDDFSTDNVTLLNDLYQQHGRGYLVIEQGIWSEDPRVRRAEAGSACYGKYRAESDWLINLDVDEFVWSPKYSSLPEYFMHEVPETTHILYVGASRFGWGGQRHRYTYSLTQVGPVTSYSKRQIQQLERV